MKKVLSILLLAALMLGLSVPALAEGTPTFTYELQLTDGAGKTISAAALNTLKAGDQVNLSIHLQRTDITDASYGIYGIEFQIRSRGLTYNNDGVCFREGSSVNLAQYLSGDVVGFAWIDMNEATIDISNPEDVCHWSYTVSEPSKAILVTDVALVYVGGSGAGTVTTKYDVLLDPNGGSVDGTDVSGTYASGTKLTLPGAVREGYEFVGWNDGAADYKAGDSYTVTKSAILTAKWTQVVHITLRLTGGTVVGDDVTGEYEVGETITLPDAVRDGYTFDGWLDESTGTTYKPGDTITLAHDSILFAQWTPSSPIIIPTVERGEHFNYIIGYPDGGVHPTANITRAEVATIIYRVLSAESREQFLTEENSFSDVSEGAWYNTAISTLANAGILNGYRDGTFRPNAMITRAEVATIISRFTKISGGRASFYDSAEHWASSYIATAAENGWVTGYPDGTFRPDNPITRAETVTMINRLLDRKPETEKDLLSDMTIFNDNTDPSAWYYLQFQEAANNHEYTRKSDGVYERWVKKLQDIKW